MCVPLGVRTVRLPSSGRAQIQSIRLSASPERSSAEQTPSCTGVPVCLRETGSGFFGAVLVAGDVVVASADAAGGLVHRVSCVALL